jgi:hypothetical protein
MKGKKINSIKRDPKRNIKEDKAICYLQKKRIFLLKSTKIKLIRLLCIFFRDKGLIFYSSSLLFILRSSLCIYLSFLYAFQKNISFLFHFILFVHTKMLLHYVYIIHIFCRFFFNIFILPCFFLLLYIFLDKASIQ